MLTPRQQYRTITLHVSIFFSPVKHTNSVPTQIYPPPLTYALHTNADTHTYSDWVVCLSDADRLKVKQNCVKNSARNRRGHRHGTVQTVMSAYAVYGIVPKGLLTLLGFFFIFYAMRSSVPVGLLRNISGRLFTWLVCGSFQWRHGLLFTIVSCDMTRTKWLVLKGHIGST